ncbi:precorrin-2 dehydrogenase / sirohydrochlorin ferrochelatase [Ekhidna lutea]|uniref:precorrin-2 dehydrogenase n=1 Tax=Ekhidna lutea TaxID=447679 RepID=A0A239LJD9_EKHLU|nr:bifunctional precorrin-2 dehydrogenase/sirohydrochlorin ferrochelatase [Ekhidna lutea]SNT30018.1 precorrin-2 dehydrogenase / sirohydrochlorin ferrochelatase [Ekhidna lutea]
MTTGNSLFPVFIKLDQIHTLIVGGGSVGLEKLDALLRNDHEAQVTIVSKKINREIRQRQGLSRQIKLIERPFRKSDLKGKDLVILATDDQRLHSRIRSIARKKHLLINVADTPHLCDFYLGSTVKKGDLKIGISTNGKSPTFSKRLKEVLNETLPDETDLLLQNLKVIRDRLKGDFSFKVKALNGITKSLIDRNEV